ncbi:unnamed protein product [Trifolium pratense]|uniref:Uncharacterized protein n=1 Tax=Trifolium pratense TaxID=57577 RepID=A0ACB0KGN2_TRIPR|nr:unnamed protein product [Trifolium pratense]
MAEGFKVVLVINYTKNTIQVYQRDGLLATSDEEEWQRVISNIEPGNKIKVVVVFTNEFIVKKTTIYLVYDEPNEEQTNHCHETDENGLISTGDENSGCNYFDWDYEEVADVKDLIIMKQKRSLEVLTRVSDEQGQQLLEEKKKLLEKNDEQNQRIDHQKQKIVAV